MRDSDFWSRDYRRRQMRGRSIQDNHAEAMELLAQGNLILADEIVDRLELLWRGLRRRFVTGTQNQDLHRP